jgi:hypothetical protein
LGGFAGRLDDLRRAHRLATLEFLETGAIDVNAFGLLSIDHVEFVGRIEHGQRDALGNRAPAVRDVLVEIGVNRLNRLFIDARRADGGVLFHDDLLAGNHGQNGVALDRLRNVSDSPRGIEFVAGEIVGNARRVEKIAPAAEVLLPFRHVELEDQHRHGVFGRRLFKRTSYEALDPRQRLPVNWQLDADHPADRSLYRLGRVLFWRRAALDIRQNVFFRLDCRLIGFARNLLIVGGEYGKTGKKHHRRKEYPRTNSSLSEQHVERGVLPLHERPLPITKHSLATSITYAGCAVRLNVPAREPHDWRCRQTPGA